CLLLEVAGERLQGVRKGRGLAALTQAEIYREHLAGAGDGGQERVEAVDDAVEVDVGRRTAFPRPAVENHEVQVGSVVELPAAELAQADDQRRHGSPVDSRLPAAR